MASQERGDRCYYNLRAQIKLYGEVDIQDSERSSLRECLYGCNGKVMCSDSNRHNGHLDPKNPRYAPKLAAAVRAWQAVTDPGKVSPKKALTKWLREHAAEFGLSDDEGKPNETGIEEVAKVANWQPGGGAPKTPGG